ncbi:MAG: hypothetical protein GTN69_11270 [Armatimonadetes bacterium]|nr:hypothetical protein [Armatimonadota bacterium]
MSFCPCPFDFKVDGFSLEERSILGELAKSYPNAMTFEDLSCWTTLGPLPLLVTLGKLKEFIEEHDGAEVEKYDKVRMTARGYTMWTERKKRNASDT